MIRGPVVPAIRIAAILALSGAASQAAAAPDYSKRAQPITGSIRAALIGKWTNQVDGLIVEIDSVDPVTGAIRGREWPTVASASGSSAPGTEHEIVGWVNAAPARPGFDNVVPVSFSTSLFEYGTLPSWAGFLRNGQIVTMHYLVWPNRSYTWDHISAYQETWTKIGG